MSIRKELLVELCDHLQQDLQVQQRLKNNPQTDTVRLVSVGYPIYSDRLQWVIEIRLNNVCIFKETIISEKEIDYEILEDMCITKILKSVFSYGVMASKNQMDKFRNVQ